MWWKCLKESSRHGCRPESKNHRTGKVGRHHSNLPAQEGGMLLRIVSRQFFNISREGHSTVILGSLFPCSAVLTLKNFFLIFQCPEMHSTCSIQVHHSSIKPPEKCCHISLKIWLILIFWIASFAW